MAKYVAAEVVEPLEFDFTTEKPDPDAAGIDPEEAERRRGLDKLEWAGVITEPSDRQISEFFQGRLPDIRLASAEGTRAFLDRQRAARLEWWHEQPHPAGELPPGVDDIDALDIPTAMLRAEQAAYAEFVHQDRETARQATIQALAEFCGHHPSTEVLSELHWRSLTSFLGWVTGQFRPETLAAAINR